LTLYYNDGDITGLDETKLVLGRYDEIHSRWITLPTTVYPDENKIVCRINHLSKFAVLQLVPANDLSNIMVYPNPFKPREHTNGLMIVNLTARASIKIYTIAGELVREMTDFDGDGRIVWNGKNDNGSDVASGVYIGLIKGAGKKKVKIAIIR